jgi:deazaflavin-dependent oxidoreductase (nitroreductase family)
MGGDRLWKLLNRTHRALLRLPGGAGFWRRAGMPVLELTTTGRRSRQPHSVLLTSPVSAGEAFVVVASRGGDRRHPAWFLNLRDDPRVRVRTRQGTRDMMARVATDAERTELWPSVTRTYPPYATYQEKAGREIPLILLTPA